MTSNRYSQLLKTPEFRALRDELTGTLKGSMSKALLDATLAANSGNEKEAAARLIYYSTAKEVLDTFDHLLDRPAISTALPNASMSYNDTV